MTALSADSGDSFLSGIRVLEIADELGEYCGKLLAGLGADVVKVEPPGGEVTRGYGPFRGDVEDVEDSLHFWHYNHGKRSVVLDLDTDGGRRRFGELAAVADVVLDTRRRGYLEERGLGADRLRAARPELVTVRISPFGDTGPWADREAGDLVHLALGGVVMNCGYDPGPAGEYDTPPIAPQMWQSYHITGEMAVMAILGALTHRLDSGAGQHLDVSVHQAVSANTETDIPDWVMLRQEHHRLTGRHSMPASSVPSLALTKDGRYVMPYRTYLKSFAANWEAQLRVLRKFGMQADLDAPEFQDEDYRYVPRNAARINQVLDEFVGRMLFDADIWRDAQAEGLPWAPVRRPEENADDEHWRARGTFVDVRHPELDETYTYVGSRWYCPDVPWVVGTRPPRLGEHADEVAAEWAAPRAAVEPAERPARTTARTTSATGAPFALAGVRVLDLSWMLASAGSGRFLAALGAEVIKVEHESRWDAVRFGQGMAPPGGRAQRDAATEAIPTPEPTGPDCNGMFMEVNSGKLGMSLDLKHPRSRAVLEDLVRASDVLVEGFSPGTMERMGLGYARLAELNPRIVYVQQSGFGQYGTYGQARAFGPTAQAFSGLTEMSGLPEPFPPAGIGYSYLDWFGAYNMANAVLAGIYRQRRTGEGCYIDASQTEMGIYLAGTAILDHSVNGRRWQRHGNTSPYKAAAPHGVFRTRGTDRWIALSVFTPEQWAGLVEVLGEPALADERFATPAGRLAAAEELDGLVAAAVRNHEGRALMDVLQERGVPAGVCQTVEDRYDLDPQLRHLQWTVELPQPAIGTWPIRQLPVALGATPADAGGPYGRSGPSYGQDTDHVLREVLGYEAARISELRADGAV
ncbi:hypothetical protein GCM10009836_02770 [Pseudonocardia ailaonensis]|uniref:Acyl-CoA transferase n=1 Tax=Pseudonocardia ailaonensis TaxID=367279 RepID=A0ABN2MJS6_9PSEU